MEEFYVVEGNTKIFGRHWAVENPVGVVLMVHGMGTHSGRYYRTAGFLNNNRIAAIGYDHPGHGNSEGQRGHIPKYEMLLDVLDRVLSHVRQLYPDLPVFIYGHSMGGNVVANFVLRRQPPVAGVILSSPWLKLAFNPPFFKMMLAKLVVNIFPALRQSSKLDVNYISHDKDILKEYNEDKLIHSYITPQFFLSTTRAGLWALANASRFAVPLYIYHGTADRITLFSATKLFASRISNARFRQWEGCYHEVHNEWVRDELYASIMDFISGLLPQAAEKQKDHQATPSVHS